MYKIDDVRPNTYEKRKVKFINTSVYGGQGYLCYFLYRLDAKCDFKIVIAKNYVFFAYHKLMFLTFKCYFKL